MTDLTELRADIEAELAEAHVRRGRALLDNQPLPDADIAGLERALEDIAAAEGEHVRRERERSAQEERERIAREEAYIEKKISEMLAKIDREDQLHREARAVGDGVVADANDIRAAYRRLNRPPPPGTDAREQNRRWGYRFSQRYSGMHHRGRIGEFIELRVGPYPKDEAWAESEARYWKQQEKGNENGSGRSKG